LSGVIKVENVVHFYLANLGDVLYGFLDAPFLWLGFEPWSLPEDFFSLLMVMQMAT
jgi:hypothetical protein